MKATIEELMQVFRLQIDRAGENDKGCAFNGEMSSHVQTARRRQDLFLAGASFERTGEVPEYLEKEVMEIKRINDPEYAEFLRLKEKFNG